MAVGELGLFIRVVSEDSGAKAAKDMVMSQIQISKRPFSEVDINDPFFDSLKAAYRGFEPWFTRKAEELAYVGYDDDGKVRAFVYLKRENETVTDVTPPILGPCLKVGTLKIDAHGTRLGERFVKIIFDELRHQELSLAYVTIFREQERLISLLERYGFIADGRKGDELVYTRRMPTRTGNPLFDYPVVRATGVHKWMLAIRPDFHTRLFPDSILHNESPDIIQDVPETNGIHKVYIGRMFDFPLLSPGDCLIIYRCQNARAGRPWFQSVATSLCVLEEIRPKGDFPNEADFLAYCKKYSVFSDAEIINQYRAPGNLHALKMTYNFAFPRRPNLQRMVEHGAVPHPREGQYMGLLGLSDEAFSTILRLGGIDERLAVY